MVLLFSILSFMTLGSAVAVILMRNPIYSLLMLVLSFMGIAGFFFLLKAPFLGIVQLIVYAGAIMVLFLFTMMLMNLNHESEPRISGFKKIVGGVSATLLLVAMVLFALPDLARLSGLPAQAGLPGTAQALGLVLFGEYISAFELSSVLFLAAIVGVVMIGQTLQKGRRS